MLRLAKLSHSQIVRISHATPKTQTFYFIRKPAPLPIQPYHIHPKQGSHPSWLEIRLSSLFVETIDTCCNLLVLSNLHCPPLMTHNEASFSSNKGKVCGLGRLIKPLETSSVYLYNLILHIQRAFLILASHPPPFPSNQPLPPRKPSSQRVRLVITLRSPHILRLRNLHHHFLHHLRCLSCPPSVRDRRSGTWMQHTLNQQPLLD